MIQWFQKQLERVGLVGGQAEALVASEREFAPVSLLLVDDTPENIQVLMETLKPLGHKLLAAKDGESALNVARRAKPAMILLDVMMPRIDGYEVCRRLKADPETAQSAVIFCSSLDDTASKVKGLQLGAVDFVSKPFEPEEVLARVNTHLAVQQLARSLASRNQSLARELAIARADKHDALRRLGWAMLGGSPAMLQARAAVDAAAGTHEPVLLRSAPDCGAEALARAIHAASSYREGAFIVVDGAQLSASLSVSDASAFTRGGAEPSRLEQADGGTLFIDRVDRIGSPSVDELAAYVAEAAEARAAQRRPTPDVRVVAVSGLLEGPALPSRLPVGLRAALTRQVIRVPTLAERREDIEALAREVLSRQERGLGRSFAGFEPSSREQLAAHQWPGNLRELEDVVARSAASTPPESPVVRVDPSLLQLGISLGSYTLVRRLGAGGCGEVWAARHQLLARPAAVKLIIGDSHAEPEVIERFRREAKATASLASPHTVTLYDFGVSEQGQFYYVMELLDGADLDQLLERFGPLPPARLAHVLVHACRSLAEAHSLGMVHRDLKPSNLFAARLGLEVDVVKVLDFGLARQTTEQHTRLTQQNAILGTPDFIAPETAMHGEVDGRTDVYSLCATAYTLATGRPMFTGPTAMAVVLQHLQATPAPLHTVAPQVPEALSAIIMAGLAKGLADRPDALSMLRALLATGLPQAWSEEAQQAWWRDNMPPRQALLTLPPATSAATSPTMYQAPGRDAP